MVFVSAVLIHSAHPGLLRKSRDVSVHLNANRRSSANALRVSDTTTLIASTSDLIHSSRTLREKYVNQTGLLTNAPAARFLSLIFVFLPPFHMDFSYKYVFFIKGDTIDQILEEALHFVYSFLGRALQARRQRDQNGE